MADWSAVYLGNTLGTTAAFAAAGYAVFAAAMVVGRFAGDWATARLKPARVIRYGGALVAAGLGAGLLIGQPWSALLGFACVGIGLSCAFPVLLSVAGQTTRMAPGVAISAVAMLGYTGFLAGPPIIGFVAEITGLRVGLGLVALLGMAIVALSRLVRWPEGVAPPA
jgi:fucose permease